MFGYPKESDREKEIADARGAVRWRHVLTSNGTAWARLFVPQFDAILHKFIKPKGEVGV